MESKLSKSDYIRKVLEAYRRMPGAAGAIRRNDRILAATLFDRGVPLSDIENALILAAARRISRSPHAPALQPVRSLHYLLPVIEEVLAAHVTPDYYRYLQFKIDQASNRKKPL